MHRIRNGWECKPLSMLCTTEDTSPAGMDTSYDSPFLTDRRRTSSLQKMQRPCQKCNERSFRELRGTLKYIVPMFIIMIGPFWTASVFYAVRSVIVVHNSVSVVPRGPHRCRRMDTLPLPFLDYRPRPCCSPLLLRASKPRSPLRNSQ